MCERLLTQDQVASRLGVVRRTIHRNIHTLKAKGLQEVKFGTRGLRYRESSLDRIIKRAAEREEKIF